MRWLSLAVLITAVGCISWTPGWQEPFRPEPLGPTASVTSPDELFDTAGDAAALTLARRAYEGALVERPDEYELLVRLAEIRILEGAAYSDTRKQKGRNYIAGIRLAEQAMATHPGFRRQIEAGATMGAAVGELGPAHMKAMLLWVTGVSYYFNECLSGLGHVVNFRWMGRTRETMQHMMQVDPDFEYGAVPFSLGIYYLALPPSAGGDLARSEALIEQAVQASEDHLLARWGRAKYLAVQTGDRVRFEADLRWVLEQDPERISSPFAWNVYMQRDAEQMLAEADKLFPRGG